MILIYIPYIVLDANPLRGGFFYALHNITLKHDGLAEDAAASKLAIPPRGNDVHNTHLDHTDRP